MCGSPAGKHKNGRVPLHRGPPSPEMLRFRLERHKDAGAPSAGAARLHLFWSQGCLLAASGSLRIVLLVAVQLVRIVGGHVGKILEDVLEGLVSCKWESSKLEPRRQR